MSRIPRLLWYLAGIWFVALIFLFGPTTVIGDGWGDLEVEFQVVDAVSGSPIDNAAITVVDMHDNTRIPRTTVLPLRIESNCQVFLQSNNGFSTHDIMLGPFKVGSKLYVEIPCWDITVEADGYESQQIKFLPSYMRDKSTPPERLRRRVYQQAVPIHLQPSASKR